ncbi:hypothetical protein FPQ18DRAFT_380920 [Pyronema domesticum]|nr:hypothetical protein FPQ18DRAFT_380920 [Pyronema domesticum]
MPHVTALLTPLDLKSLQTLSKHLGLSSTGTKPLLTSIIYNLPHPPRPDRLLSLVFSGAGVTSCLITSSPSSGSSSTEGTAGTASPVGTASSPSLGAAKKSSKSATAAAAPKKARIQHHPLHLPSLVTPPFGYLTTALEVNRVISELLKLRPDYVLIQHKRWDLLRGNHTGVVEGMVFAGLWAQLSSTAGTGAGTMEEATTNPESGAGTGNGAKRKKVTKKEAASGDWRQGDLYSPPIPAGVGIEGVDGNLIKAMGAKAKKGVKEVFVEVVEGEVGFRKPLTRKQIKERIEEGEGNQEEIKKKKAEEALVQGVCWGGWMENREAVLVRGDWPEGSTDVGENSHHANL